MSIEIPSGAKERHNRHSPSGGLEYSPNIVSNLFVFMNIIFAIKRLLFRKLPNGVTIPFKKCQPESIY